MLPEKEKNSTLIKKQKIIGYKMAITRLFLADATGLKFALIFHLKISSS